MEIGTAEPIEESQERVLKRKPGRHQGRRKSGGGSGGGDNGDNNGGGNGSEKPPEHGDTDDLQTEAPEKSRILMWFLLVVVMMTFGGLISAYIVISTNNALEWKPFALPVQVWISTIIILASSFTYNFAKSSLNGDRIGRAKRWFVITTALGAAFISSQILAWLELVGRGFYMKGNPYAGFFYILTAIHAVHVLGGIIALGYVLLRTWNTTSRTVNKRKRKAEAQAIGWYWHTMDGLWLVLLFLLGFWK